MSRIVKVEVSKRGPQGAIDPQDRARIDAAVEAAAALDDAVSLVNDAASQATQAAGQVADVAGQVDAAAQVAEAAKGEAAQAALDAQQAAQQAAAAVEAELSIIRQEAQDAASTATQAASTAAQDAAAADAIRQEVATDADRAEAARDDASAVAGIREFRDLPTLLANATLTYGSGAAQVQAGDIVRTRAEGFIYRVLSLGAVPHVATAGGVLLEVLPINGAWCVDAFDAKGNGIADDLAAIQKAASSAPVNAILTFSGGKHYRLSGTVNIDFTKLRAIDGHGARLTILSDVPIFQVAGGKSSKTGGAVTADNKLLVDAGGWNVIERLKFACANADTSYGVAIRLTNTIGVRIRNNDFLNIGEGIVFNSYNRNAAIHDNYFFNIRHNGIHLLPGHNIHQLAIHDNQASGFERMIYNEDAECVNMLVSNNHFECGLGEQVTTKSIIHISSSAPNLEGQIIGNHFQDHKSVTEGLLIVDRGVGAPASSTARWLQVDNNEFSNTPAGIPAVKMRQIDSFSICGNRFYQTEGYCVDVESASGRAYAKVSSNIGWDISNFCRAKFYEVSVLEICDNSGQGGSTTFTDRFIFVDLTTVIGGGLTKILRVQNNSFETRWSGVVTDNWLIDIQSAGSMRAIHVSGNSLALTHASSSANGVRVSNTSGSAYGFIRDNIVWRIGGTPFQFPTEGALIRVSDNLSNAS